jgi:hypothetical protein
VPPAVLNKRSDAAELSAAKPDLFLPGVDGSTTRTPAPSAQSISLSQSSHFLALHIIDHSTMPTVQAAAAASCICSDFERFHHADSTGSSTGAFALQAEVFSVSFRFWSLRFVLPCTMAKVCERMGFEIVLGALV